MSFLYFDFHSHLQDPRFDADRDALIASMKDAGVGALVVGTDRVMSEGAVALAEMHENLWATVGLHPTDNVAELFDFELYEKLARHPKTVAIGECGLDYFHEKTDVGRASQKELFKKQIEIALKVGKPLMIHCREAYGDLLEILDQYPGARGNVHFFAGTWPVAQEFLKRGFTLSFTGVITFARDYDEVIKNAPLHMMMAETDCPYVAPLPYRGKRNEPRYVLEVFRKISEIRGEDFEVVRSALVENSERFLEMQLNSEKK